MKRSIMKQCPTMLSTDQPPSGSISASSEVAAATDRSSRRRLHPGKCPAETPVFGSLTRGELRRRFWHLAPGALGFLMPLIYHRDPISMRLTVILLSATVAITYFLVRDSHRIRRQNEQNLSVSIAGYAVSVMGVWLLFPAHAELGLSVLMVLAFGDGLATLGGLSFGGRRLPWNQDKTWAGSLCFFLGSAPAATLAFWAEARPAVQFEFAALCAGTAALAGAIAESLPTRINDNIRVGFAAATAIAVAHTIFSPIS